VLILLISLLLLEVVLRIYQVVFPSFVFHTESYQRFRGRPYSEHFGFKLNSGGFKDLEFGAKREDVYRIVAVGDSFAFGVVPYPDNYLTLLERDLQREIPAEVLNLGIPGIGPEDYLSLFVDEGLALQPDMLLLSFFVGNDFLESERPRYSYSYALSLLRFLTTVAPEFEGQDMNWGTSYCDACPTFGEEAYLELERGRSFPLIVGNGQFAKLLPNAVHYLDRLGQICNEHDIRLLVALIPDEIQVNGDLREKVRRRFFPGVDASAWDPDLPNRALATALADRGIASVDLYPEFAQAPGPPLYRLRDSHWNLAGNRLAAQVLGRAILGMLSRLEQGSSGGRQPL
jgi:hypothetical protein